MFGGGGGAEGRGRRRGPYILHIFMDYITECIRD